MNNPITAIFIIVYHLKKESWVHSAHTTLLGAKAFMEQLYLKRPPSARIDHIYSIEVTILQGEKDEEN